MAQWQVNFGVSVGERVVVDGTGRLRDGARVIMPAAPSQAPAADPPSNAQNPQPQNPTPSAQPQSPGHSQHQHKQRQQIGHHAESGPRLSATIRPR